MDATRVSKAAVLRPRDRAADTRGMVGADGERNAFCRKKTTVRTRASLVHPLPFTMIPRWAARLFRLHERATGVQQQRATER
jgi:hypothetical protein